MSDSLVHNSQALEIARAGRVKTVREGDLTNDTVLRQGEEVTVYSTQIPADFIYAWGAGSDDRNRGRTAYVYAQLQADGTGNGSAGEAITGDLVARITDSEQRDVHARTEVGDLTELSDAQADDRTDRPLFPVRVPVGREDQHLELAVIADSNADGYQLDDGTDQNTDVRLKFTKIPV